MKSRSNIIFVGFIPNIFVSFVQYKRMTVVLTRPTIRPGLAGTVPEFKVLSRSAERKSRFFMESASYASLLRQKFRY